jgi:hypothetical protein
MPTTDTPFYWPAPLREAGYPEFDPVHGFRNASYWEIPKLKMHELLWRIRAFSWTYTYDVEITDPNQSEEDSGYTISGVATMTDGDIDSSPIADEHDLLIRAQDGGQFGWIGYGSPDPPPFLESGAGVIIGGRQEYDFVTESEGPYWYDRDEDKYFLNAFLIIGADPAIAFQEDHPDTDPTQLKWAWKDVFEAEGLFIRTREMKVFPHEWWAYDPGDTASYPGKVGSGNIYNTTNGAILRNPLAISRRKDGTFYNPIHV